MIFEHLRDEVPKFYIIIIPSHTFRVILRVSVLNYSLKIKKLLFLLSTFQLVTNDNLKTHPVQHLTSSE